MDSLVLVFVVVAALLVIASGVWVATVLVAVTADRRRKTEVRGQKGRGNQ
jgi:hypothetical protein